MSDHDERVQQVIDELDPTPAHEADWPVSRRQTLRALAAAGLLGAGSGSASAESVGGVIADEATLSNYGSESVSDGWELTIDDDVFALTASDTETMGLPDGAVGEELVTPSGGEASEIVAPDGTVVFDSVDILDSEGLHEWLLDEGEGPTAVDRVGNADMSLTGTWVTGEGVGGAVFECTGDNDLATASEADLTDWGDSGAILLPFHISSVTASDQTFWWSLDSNRMYSRISGDSSIHVGLAGTANDTGHGVAPGDINTGEWNGWGVSWDGGSYDVVLYDYATESSTTGSGTYSGTVSKDDDFDVGGRSDSNDPIDGKFDFPRVYGNSLSQAGMISRFEELAFFYP